MIIRQVGKQIWILVIMFINNLAVCEKFKAAKNWLTVPQKQQYE